MSVTNFMRGKKFFIFGAFSTTLIILIFTESKVRIPKQSNLSYSSALDTKSLERWLSLRTKNTSRYSKLGEILFLEQSEPIEANRNAPKNGKFLILVWKYGKYIEKRHLQQFSGKTLDPFEHCPVKNCDITYSDDALRSADIVIFHLHRIKGTNDLPKRSNEKQIWAFLTDESPYNTFMSRKNNKLPNYNGIFNWSMTYRMDSDIPVPYGRTVSKAKSDPYATISLNKRRDILVAIMGSNCGGINHRWKYVKELQKHIKVDVYGGCGPIKSCPGHFGSDCPAIGEYLFYLSFENSNCEEYITEKLWWNAYSKNSIPIVMGSSKKNYAKLLPPDSYINIEDFASPAALAQNLLRLNETEDFLKYYRWKANFEVLNEHGYFQSKSYHFCRICQALNYNSREPKTYDNLQEYWSVEKNCHPAWDAWID